MQAVLEAEELNEDDHLNVSLTGRDSMQNCHQDLYVQLPSVLTGLCHNSLGAWGFIDDVGCPRFSESEVTGRAA